MNSTTNLPFPLARGIGVSLITCLSAVPAVLAVPAFEFVQGYDGPTVQRESPLFQAADGSLYGVTVTGGTSGYGMIFKVAPDRKLTVLENLSQNTIWNVRGPLVQGLGNYLYGTSGNGGKYDAGTIFRITADGGRTPLYNFYPAIGSFPVGPLVKGDDDSYYGVTSSGGANGGGVVYRMSMQGAVVAVKSLSQTTGFAPGAGLTRETGKTFFGTTTAGGSNQMGTIFKVDSLGALTVLVNFTGTNGSYPSSEIVKGGVIAQGNYYGTTNGGGTYDDGTIFRMTPSGQLTTIYSFKDGLGPKSRQAGLALGQDGNFYSVTYNDGTYKKGTIYQLTPGGTFSVIANFDGKSGSYPDAPLAVGADGNLYGITTADGTNSSGQPVKGGQIFRLRFGPSPVTTIATSILTTSCRIHGMVSTGALTSESWFEYGTSPTLADSSASAKTSVPINSRPYFSQILLSGLQPGTKYYYRVVASNAENPFPQAGQITSFTTLPASIPQADLWRFEHFNQSASTGNAAESADPDQDGVPNLLERAFNLSPNQSDATVMAADTGITGLPDIRATGDAGDLRLKVEYLRRTAASNSGLVYQPEGSDQPGGESGWESLTGSETVTPIDADWERVVFQEDAGGSHPERFGRLRVSTSP